MAIKGQAITDFIVEFTNMEGQRAEACLTWSIHMDRIVQQIVKWSWGSIP